MLITLFIFVLGIFSFELSIGHITERDVGIVCHLLSHIVCKQLSVLGLLYTWNISWQEVNLRLDMSLEHGEEDAGHSSMGLVPGPTDGVVNIRILDHDRLDSNSWDEASWFEGQDSLAVGCCSFWEYHKLVPL